jgi:alkylation response protein AidB-like acyl-CoA dehydrogenase
MDFPLSAAHQKIRQFVADLATEFATWAAQHDRETSLPVENYDALRRAGLYGLTAPKEYGGWVAQ